MKLGNLQSQHGDFYTPRFRVVVGEKTFTEADGVLSDLSVDLTLEGADRFSFSLNYLYDHPAGKFSKLDWDLFAVGTSVVVWMGYETPTPKTLPLLVGTISSVKPSFPAGGNPTVAVSGYDLLHETTKGTDQDSWNGRTDSQVVQDRLKGQGFELRDSERTEAERWVGIEETGETHSKTIQDKESDYAFVKKLADRNGFEFFAEPSQRGGTWTEVVNFRPPAYARTSKAATPRLTLRYGDSLFSFSPEVSNANQVNEVEVRHWNEKQKTEIVGRATNPGGKGKRVVRAKVDSVDQANTVARAVLDSIAEGLVTGSGETIGLPDLRLGELVELEGIDKFAKIYYVEQITHSIGSSGYRSSFQVREPPAMGPPTLLE